MLSTPIPRFIQTDIDDKPPNPNASPPPSKMKPRPKPWERGARGSGIDSGLGGGGGSSSSLASLGAAGAPGAPQAAAEEAPVAAQRQAAEEPPAAQNGPAPVHAPSPAAETAEAAAPAEGQVAAAEQGLPPVQPAAYAPGSFPSPKRASSIFEAGERWQRRCIQATATDVLGPALRAGCSAHLSPLIHPRTPFPLPAVAPAPESPHIFAGRLSPVRGSSGLGRSDSGVLGGGASGSATGGSSTFAAILAAAQDRATGAAPLTASQEGSVAEGSGIGRPVSRGWRPPPIPAPTLGASGGGGSDSGSASRAGAAGASGPGHSSGEGGQVAAPARAPSAASLGEDFAGA